MPRRCLVTAGNTRESIDRVRDWGNIFTGNTGRGIAEAIASLGDGVSVELLTSNAQHAQELRGHSRIAVELFRSHADLRALLAGRMGQSAYDAVFMTAAVADYTPQRVYAVQQRTVLPNGSEQWVVRDAQAGKVKSTHDAIAVLGARTEKLVDLFRTEWAYRGLLVKFKLEVGLSEDRLIEVAQASRLTSGADFIVANTLEMVSGDNAGAWLLGERIRERICRTELATRLARLVWAA
jgi:phosphopantothenoylcysteine synthetase/decarboxylase